MGAISGTIEINCESALEEKKAPVGAPFPDLQDHLVRQGKWC